MGLFTRKHSDTQINEYCLKWDIHTHILPGIDDGSPDLATTQQMLQRLISQGVEYLCVTPHFFSREQSIASFLKEREAALKKMQTVLPSEIRKVIPGAEVAYFPGIFHCEELDKLCYEGTSTLLLEMPYEDWDRQMADEVTDLVMEGKCRVILAHPERFAESKINRMYIAEFAQLPIAFQANGNPFLHRFGKKKAIEILQLSQTPMLASDSHDLRGRTPQTREAGNVLREALGTDFLRQMDKNAAAWVCPQE